MSEKKLQTKKLEKVFGGQRMNNNMNEITCVNCDCTFYDYKTESRRAPGEDIYIYRCPRCHYWIYENGEVYEEA